MRDILYTPVVFDPDSKYLFLSVILNKIVDINRV